MHDYTRGFPPASINKDQGAEIVAKKQHTDARTVRYVRLCFDLIFQFLVVLIALALAGGGSYEIQSARGKLLFPGCVLLACSFDPC